MTDTQNVQTITKLAGADLSAKQYYAVKFNSSGQVVLASTGDVAFLLMNKPASGDAAEVAISGIAKGFSSGVITAGALCYSDSNGKLTATGAAGKVSIGVALETAAANQIVQVLLSQSNVPA
jgi:predicted RecA/RadA family phage recombinase